MKNLLIAFFLFTSSMFIYAEEVPANRESVKKLIEMKDSPRYISELGNKILNIADAFNIDITNNTRREINRIIGKNNLTEQLISIYQKHYTQMEIDALLEFYLTDIGRKILQSEKDIREDIEISTQSEVMKILQIGLTEYYLKNFM